jgi:hypothetical protein
MMQITYAFAGFAEVSRDGNQVILESDLQQIQPAAGYVTVAVGPGA